MYGLFWDIPMYAAAASAEHRAMTSEHTAFRAERRVRELEERVEKLTMICAAMWALIKPELKLTDQHLMKMVEQIDLTDGALDGRVRQAIVTCSRCGRSIAARHSQCLYCGERAERSGAFGEMM